MIRILNETETTKFESLFNKTKDLYLSIFPDSSCFYDKDDGMFYFFFRDYSSLDEALNARNHANDPFQVDFVVDEPTVRGKNDDNLIDVSCNRAYVKKKGVYGNQKYHWVKSPSFRISYGGKTEKEWLKTFKNFFENLKKTTDFIGWKQEDSRAL